MKLVRHVLEELRRFNPEAYVLPEIEFQSASPMTSCLVTIGDFEGQDLEDVFRERDDLDTRYDELIDGFERIKDAMKKLPPDMEAIKQELIKQEI